jgi:A/G-specific adenine glycosylase
MAGSRKSSVDARVLLAWYDRNRRDLPWRARPGETVDPYAVWLSEIMLQQTTVAAVKPYFAAFLARWPTIRDLAGADREAVMRAWAGLGYYSRARNLHACAAAVAARPGAQFPDTEEGLRELPGLGPYTAAAVAAIAFGRRAVVIDGNVERVVARLFAISDPPPLGKRKIREKADGLTPPRRAGDFAQGMMDLGATICTPKKPACALCPFLGACEAQQFGAPEAYPVKAARKARPRRSGAVFYLRRQDGAILVRTRPAKGLLGGMTEFPGSEWSEDFCDKTPAGAPLVADWRRLPGAVEHVFTHFALRLAVYTAEARAGQPAPQDCRWTHEDALASEALPSLMRKVARLARRG